MKKLSKGESFNISRMDFQFTNGFTNTQTFKINYFYSIKKGSAELSSEEFNGKTFIGKLDGSNISIDGIE